MKQRKIDNSEREREREGEIEREKVRKCGKDTRGLLKFGKKSF